jgi:hypothetical protein
MMKKKVKKSIQLIIVSIVMILSLQYLIKRTIKDINENKKTINHEKISNYY